MRKQTKLVAVLSAAALLAIGASMTSFAARGWQEENGTWYYYNTDDDYVTDEWKKSGNNWFWLNEDGEMATDALIEDGDNYYYVNANGAMVTNSWVAVEPDDDDYEEDTPDHYWYYFGSNGKAYKASSSSDGVKKKTINGKTYGFDTEGKMLFGWVNESGDRITDESPFEEAMYYFGDSDDGAMQTGWLLYTDGSDLKEEYDDLSELWFWFNPSNGEMKKAEAGKDSVDKTINGRKYRFDENGVMMSEWGWDATISSASLKYFNGDTDGHMTKKGWIWAIPDEDYIQSDYEDDTYRWFYADGSGNAETDKIKKINGKKYLFDSYGRMKSGLVLVEDGKFVGLIDTDATDGKALRDGVEADIAYDSEDDPNPMVDNENVFLYYFGDEETDGSMKTGKNIKVEFQDDTYTMAFETSGKGMNKKDGSKLYKNGFLATASSDNKYEVVDFEDGHYLVGTSGTIVKKGKYVKDADDNYYAVYGSDKAKVVDYNGDDFSESATEPEYGEDTAVIAKFSSDDDYAKEKARDFAKYGYIKGCVDTEDDKWVSDGNCE